jgi:hypothetical protein
MAIGFKWDGLQEEKIANRSMGDSQRKGQYLTIDGLTDRGS